MIQPSRGFALAAAFLALSAGAAAQDRFKLESPTISDGGQLAHAHVFNSFGCSGENRSPALRWTGAPQGVKSFAITMYDPDAPTGSGWWHWVVFDLPASTTGLSEGVESLPAPAVQGRTDFGTVGYGGACPPPGATPHRYVFTVHALDVESLKLPVDATAAMVGFNVNAHSLGKASLTVRYGR